MRLTPAFRAGTLLLVACALLSACSSREARTARFLQRGQQYLEQEKPEKARIEFRNALQLAPDNAEARYRSGLAEERMAEYLRALTYYQAALEADPKLDEARARLARLYMFGGAPERAMEALEPALKERPDSVPLLAMRAAVKGRLKDLDGAIADGVRAVQLAPGDEAAVIVLAGLYGNNNRPDEARALLEGSLARLPRSADLREVLAQFYAQQGETAKAEQSLLELVKLQPKQVSARVTLARYYLAVKRVDEAERTLREAISAIPDNASLPGALVQLLAEQRGLPVAEAELRAQVARQPKEYDLQFSLGRNLEQQGKSTEAEALYRKVIGAEDTKAAGLTARDRLAAMFLQKGEHTDEVKKLVAEVLAKNPRDNDALMVRSSIALGSGDAKGAIVDLRALVRDHPENVGVQRQLARAYFMSGEGQLGEDLLKQAVAGHPTDAGAHYDLAQYYLASGRGQQARTLTDALVAHDAKNIDYQQAAYKAALAGRDWPAAAAAATAVGELAPGKPIGPLLAGALAEAQGKADEALAQYQRALALEPRAQEPLASAVHLLVQQKHADRALALLDGVLAQAADDAYAHNLRGEVLASAARWAEAGTAFEAAARAAPQWSRPCHNLALVRVGQKDVDGAVQVLKESAARLGQDPTLSIDLATLQQRLGRNDEAIATYEALVARHPESELGANNLAMLLATLRTDAASLQRAADLSARFAQSRNADYLDTRGWVLLRQGKAVEAVVPLEQAVALAPEAPGTRYHLALAQYGAGQKQVARDNLERAVQSPKAFEGAAEARARLAEWKQQG